MLRLSTAKISDGMLLENLTDGKIVEASEWNDVMDNIKNAINTNAEALLSTGITAIPFVVSPYQHTNTKLWTTNGNYFSVTLYKADYRIDGPKSIKTYLIASIRSDGSPTKVLEEVQNNIEYNNDDSITIHSKSNAPILITIQGVGV